MAISQSQLLPAPFLTDVTKGYAKDIGALTAAPLATKEFAPTVAPQDIYQTDAYTMAGTAGQGIGAYDPYITGQGAYSGLPTDYRGAQDYTGPDAYEEFYSPYQKDVIDKTLAEYDVQAGKGLSGIGLLAAKSGNLGGGREGVMRSEFQTKSDLQRALLDYQMRNQGFMQANQLAGQAFGQQMNMAGTVPGLERADIAGLESAGAGRRATAQAEIDAERETKRLAAYEPYERLGYLGSGIGSMLSGYPAQFQSSVQPNPTPLQTAMGIGAVGSGILGNLKGLYS